MKKTLSLFIVLACVLTLFSGCSNTEKDPKIDEYTWNMTSVQGNEDGAVIACSPELSSSYESAEKIILICEAQKGELTIKDSTNDKSYTGTYNIIKTTPESTIYEIVIGSAKGYATTGMTTYHDESQKPTLIIAIGDYALNFGSRIILTNSSQ